MASTVREMDGCECYRVNGVEDHVHLAIRLSRTITIATLIEKLKTRSSKWLKIEDEALDGFAWQRGYFVTSIYHRDLEKVLTYIDRQEEHHRHVGFQEEYRALLVENGIEFDERYVWD